VGRASKKKNKTSTPRKKQQKTKDTLSGAVTSKEDLQLLEIRIELRRGRGGGYTARKKYVLERKKRI